MVPRWLVADVDGSVCPAAGDVADGARCDRLDRVPPILSGEEKASLACKPQIHLRAFTLLVEVALRHEVLAPDRARLDHSRRAEDVRVRGRHRNSEDAVDERVGGLGRTVEEEPPHV
jgi:hypothetical protein